MWAFFSISPINRNLVGTSMESPLKKLVISCWFVNKHGSHRQFLLLIGRLKKCSLLKPLGQMHWNLVGSIYGRSFINISISSRSVSKHGRHKQFLFLIGRFFFLISPLKPLGQRYQNMIGSIYGTKWAFFKEDLP